MFFRNPLLQIINPSTRPILLDVIESISIVIAIVLLKKERIMMKDVKVSHVKGKMIRGGEGLPSVRP